MGWVNKNSGIKKFHSTNKKKQLGGSLRPPVAPLGGGLNPNMPAPPNVGVPNPYLKEGGELEKDVEKFNIVNSGLKKFMGKINKMLNELEQIKPKERI